MELIFQCIYVGNGFIKVIVVVFTISVKMYDFYPRNMKMRERRGAIHYKQETFDLADLTFHVTRLFYIFLGCGIDLWGYFFQFCASFM